MISNSAKYALKAVLYLAVHSGAQHKILAKDIGNSINLPRAYIAKLLQVLARHHIVSSLKGPGGGFFLSTENKATPLIKIVDIIDGDMRLHSCMLGLQACNAEKPCPMHELVGQTKINFIKVLEETTIADLAIDLEAQHYFFPL